MKSTVALVVVHTRIHHLVILLDLLVIPLVLAPAVAGELVPLFWHAVCRGSGLVGGPINLFLVQEACLLVGSETNHAGELSING